MNDTELEVLINRHLDGLATEAEAATLSRELESNEAARPFYLGLARLHATLAASESTESLAEVGGSSRLPGPRFAWSPPSFFARRYALATMLVLGVLLGAVMAGVVLAYTAPARPEPKIVPVPVVDAGFESGATLKLGDVPATPGNWQGDICEIVGRTGAVKPHTGQTMLRFVSVSTVSNEANTKPICSDVWQVVTLPPGHRRTVKVHAWFNAETGAKPARFHLYAMAGAGDAATAPALWGGRFGESSDVLASGRTMKFVDADPESWEPAEVTLDVPPEARLLVIGIAAYRLPNVRQPAQWLPAQWLPAQWLPAQFADDVSVEFSVAPAQDANR